MKRNEPCGCCGDKPGTESHGTMPNGARVFYCVDCHDAIPVGGNGTPDQIKRANDYLRAMFARKRPVIAC